ncbi:MAG TPA: DUF2934 domain-containing protein [Magnetospirillum sp.]|jgi:hypothetical protein|nr:DUF2934 domain-containing protein [Magnetospirillum sp.]
MKAAVHNHLTLAESGALALADAAQSLDAADDTGTFLRALERNRKVWLTLKKVAERNNWLVPDSRLADYALSTAGTMGRGVADARLTTLIDINRRVSAELAGGDIERIRERAYYIWESRGRPMNQDLEHWLIAEMEAGHHH